MINGLANFKNFGISKQKKKKDSNMFISSKMYAEGLRHNISEFILNCKPLEKVL